MEDLTQDVPQVEKRKSKLLLWAIVLFVILILSLGAYFYLKERSQKSEQAVDTQDQIVTANEEEPKTEQQDAGIPTVNENPSVATSWKTYKNNTYGFELTLNDLWSEYITSEKTGDGNAHKYIYFLLPTTDKATGENSLEQYGEEGYASPFVISVYTLDGWENELKELAENGRPENSILKTEKYVFSWGQWQACPPDLCDKKLDVAGIIKTIKSN